MQERQDIKELFERYRQGTCTTEEQRRLHAWFNRYAANEAQGLDELREAYEADTAYRRERRWSWIPYAAAAILVISVGIWSSLNWISQHREQRKETFHEIVDIAPGSNQARLTLADGQQVDLKRNQKGIIMGDALTYENGTAVLSAGASGEANFSAVNMLQLETPKGGTYQVTLSDGTKVWLNAASKLKYPIKFAERERRVEIIGEAYFAVAKDKSKPFKVICKGHEIEVLGTEFNISAYADEGVTRTTLVKGRVRVSSGTSSQSAFALQPGQQALTNDGYTKVQEIDVQPYIAWKDGYFFFDNTSLADMMKQIANWYDVQVSYERPMPQERFSGAMSRNVTLQTVLRLLKMSEIKYHIEGRRIIIE